MQKYYAGDVMTRKFSMLKIILAAAMIASGTALNAEYAFAALPATEEMQELYNSVAEKAAKAVVSVQVVREEAQTAIVPDYFFGYAMPQERVYRRQTAGIGSGVFIDPRGYVLTNYHVVEDAVDIKITTQDRHGNEKTYMASPVAADQALDIALLKIKEGGTFPYLELNAEKNLKVGNIVIAIGYPFGFKQTVTSGIISALNAKLPVEGKRYEHLIQTDAAINPGNSGGPLLNINGEIIGINTAIASPSGAFAGMGFAVAVSEIKPVLDDMLAGRKIRRGWLGVSVIGIDRIIAMRLGLDRAAGVIVNQTVEGSPADKAGIRRGDIIIKCDGEELAGSDALVLQTFSRRPGDVISLEIIRNGRTQTVKVALGDRDMAESGTQTAVKADKGNADTFSWEGIELAATKNGAKITGMRRGSKLIGHLQKGDIVNSVNNIAINSNATMKKAFAAANIQEGVLFDITRDGHPTYVSVQIAR